MRKTAQMRCIEYERGKSLEEIVRVLVEDGATWEEIGDNLGVSHVTLRKWLQRMGARRTLKFDSDEVTA